MDLSAFAWLEPWHGAPGTPGIPGLEQELSREAGAGHSLYHFRTEAVARRFDSDDVLFRVLGADGETVGFAEVHLTWSPGRETSPDFPFTRWFATFEDWVRQSMTPDHEEWTAVSERSDPPVPD
jgi:hypothetical protein